jgi:MYXO-CTERM domain-containing protein
MRSASGRVGFGLVLVSTWAGACLSEQDKSDLAASATKEPEVIASQAISAGDVVFAVRSRLTRAFGQAQLLPSERTPRNVLDVFNTVGKLGPSAVEFLGTSGDAHKVPARVTLPARADGMFNLRHESSGVSIDVGLEGATGAAREDVDGYVVYPAGYLQGAHIVHRMTAQGTEDYVYFPETTPEKSELRYRIKLGENVAGLRLIQQSLEMLDAEGAPRLSMAPPYAVDGDGRRLAMNVALEDCAYDSSEQIPWGRTPVNPGARECTVRLTWPAEAKAPLVVDPQWILTTEMKAVRFNATATVIPILGKERVLVVGGDSGTGAMGALSSTEIYDPDSNAWTLGPSLMAPRTEHGSALVAATNNASYVHVIGGRNATGYLKTAEKIIFDQSGNGTWGPVNGLMSVARAKPAIFAFDNNKKYIAVGGYGDNEAPTKNIDLYDSVGGGAWSPMSYFMTGPRAGHAMTAVTAPPLPANAPVGSSFILSVLIMGGKDSGSPATNTVERCLMLSVPGSPIICSTNYTDGVAIDSMVEPRVNHVAVFDNATKKVFVFGGDDSNTIECYNPPANAWGAVGGTMQTPRSHFTVTALQPPFGKYLVVGGLNTMQNSMPLDTVGLYDTKMEAWTPVTAMEKPRARHSTVMLPDRRPLVIGGYAGGLGTAEFMLCTSDDDCAAFDGGKAYCGKDSLCVTQKMQGEMCNVATDCLAGTTCNMCFTGHCAEGVCCTTDCTGDCESCLQMNKVGECLPVPNGDPAPGHGPCSPKDADGDDFNCVGKCDGVNGGACKFPELKSCGSKCTDDLPNHVKPSTLKELFCTDDGHCALESELTDSCGEYTCSDDFGTCRLECTDVMHCVAGYACSNGQCIPGQYACVKSNDAMSDYDVVQSTIPPQNPQSCLPYRCEAGACLTKCNSVYDCISDPNANPVIQYACDDNGACVPVDPKNLPGTDSVSCAISSDQQSSRFEWLAALAVAGLFAARRNRPRA